MGWETGTQIIVPKLFLSIIPHLHSLSFPQVSSASSPTTNNTLPVSKDAGAGDASTTIDGDGKKSTLAEMTSKDYYFDSYAHFGIHEVGMPSLSSKSVT